MEYRDHLVILDPLEQAALDISMCVISEKKMDTLLNIVKQRIETISGDLMVRNSALGIEPRVGAGETQFVSPQLYRLVKLQHEITGAQLERDMGYQD